MIDLYVREYARLLCERAAQVDSAKGIENEAGVRLKDLQSKVRRRELDRFIAEQSGPGPISDVKARASASRLRVLARKGIGIAGRALSFFFAWITAHHARLGKKKRTG